MRQQRKELQEADERIGPAMDQQDGQGGGACSLFVDEMEPRAVQVGAEMPEAVEIGLLLWPVEAVAPVVAQRSEIVRIRAIVPAGIVQAACPSCPAETLLEVVQHGLRHADLKRLNGHDRDPDGFTRRWNARERQTFPRRYLHIGRVVVASPQSSCLV